MEAFNYSLTRTFDLAIASGTLAFAGSLAIELGNVKRERKDSRDSLPTKIEPATHSARSGIFENVPMSVLLCRVYIDAIPANTLRPGLQGNILF